MEMMGLDCYLPLEKEIGLELLVLEVLDKEQVVVRTLVENLEMVHK
jgi:hypothetical protein